MDCTLCNKPLGAESIDLGYKLCHDCRKCSKCALPVTKVEQDFCIDNQQAIAHARCMSLSDVATLPAQVLLINIRRLQAECLIRIPEMSLDQIRDLVSMCQETAGSASAHLAEKRALTTRTEKTERDSKRARNEANTSSRPVGKSPSEPNEQQIAWFMQTYSVNRPTALDSIKKRDKAIKNMTNMGMPELMAIEAWETEFCKQRKITLPAKPSTPSTEVQ